MAAPLHIDASLITEALLLQQHQGEREVSISDGAIITPSARDYLRLHRITVVDGGRVATQPAAPQGAARQSSTASASSGAGTSIQEVLPPGAEGGMLYRGRYDHPDKAFGCRTEEFGSGFVEPACCAACAAKGSNGGAGCDCDGCNRQGEDPRREDAQFEALVQRLTDEIMARLGS